MRILTDNQIQKFKNFIDNHTSFIVVGHKEPDGDCIASSLGVAAILNKMNKPCQLVSAGPFKRTELKDFEKHFTREATVLHTGSVGLIIVDCGEFKRIGEVFPPDSLITGAHSIDTFVIDHHKTSSPETDAFIIEPDSPATAYLVQQLYEGIIGPLEKETAEILFLGLATDTGYFRFLEEGSGDVFHAAARMVDAQVSPRVTYDVITRGKSFNTRKLLGIMLERAEQKFNGRLILTYETLEDTRKYGGDGRDSDSLYQLLLSCADVEAVVFIRQETDSGCTMGFRSRDTIDVSAVASVFGGGGHKNAAGCSTPGKIEELIPKVLQEFEKIFS
ncbi:MAG: bifunctional oligoribonuclease/PAP phosphatase NrnA [Candidatus Treponema excrementipullorum]|uniref:Bifunctional oligoribonuclease/PAP phosphatase NrnA n=1 Tax=Candidatus Treponema excrementipullorum TaxID=2838768 RepID=A0A9E2L3H5_9SPIR|nr:bifunctional oligoribonuclease/PAP phosphatase NrnA [Candidatus Treponema excrementipullorum]